jgi:hypothetical protein
VSAYHRSKPRFSNLLRLALSDQSLTVAASEFLDPAGSIDEFLFTGEKRMASGAYTDLDIATGRPCAVNSATGASDRRLYVIRMDISLHVSKKLNGMKDITLCR